MSIGEIIGDWRDTLEERPVEIIGIDTAEGDSVTSAPVEFMPEVGQECELIRDDWGVWEKATILFIGKTNVVFTSESMDECSWVLEEMEFRPIQSARDKFVDEASLKYGFSELSSEGLGNVFDAIKAGQIPGVKLTD